MSDLQPGAVTVGDLFREIAGMRTDFGTQISGMRQEFGRALTQVELLSHQNSDADKVHADHEARLRQLEAFRWKITGLAVTLATAAGIVSGIVANNVH